MKQAKFKFGLAGTSCCGKTTLAYGIVARLKSYSLLADGVFSQDRRFSFPKEHLGETELAQHWMVTNLISKEIDMALHGDTDILITDRTPCDLYAYYLMQYPRSALCESLGDYVCSYASTYDRIYVMEPLPYQNDGKRPSDDFRMRVNETFLNCVLPRLPNAVLMPRSDILNDILLTVGFVKPNVKTQFLASDAQHLADVLQRRVVCKRPSSATSFSYAATDPVSDTDIYIIHEDWTNQQLLADLRSCCKRLFGAFVNLDVALAYDVCTFDENFVVFEPKAV